MLLLAALLVGAVAILAVHLSTSPAPRFTLPAVAVDAGAAASADTFDYERAADISVMRWQAMAHFYEEQGLLTRDDFDYEAAADNSTYRWEAMARAYERMGMLNDR
jgi:hypothetical protein